MIDFEKIKKEISTIIQHNTGRDNTLLEISKMLREEVYHYDWVGFYILNEEKTGLILGPYSGADTDHGFIPIGKGVCGQVAQSKKVMVVQDVSSIENYLSCSIDVQSEIVFPILRNGEFVAELDIDSHSPAPFTSNDNQLLTYICTELSSLFLIENSDTKKTISSLL
jgi:GAF domain-containing protein